MNEQSPESKGSGESSRKHEKKIRLRIKDTQRKEEGVSRSQFETHSQKVEESLGRIELKLDDIQEEIRKSTLSILQTLSLSEPQKKTLRDEMIRQSSQDFLTLQTMRKAVEATLNTQTEKDEKNNTELLQAYSDLTRAINELEATQKGQSQAFDDFRSSQVDLKSTQEQMLRAFNQSTEIQRRLLISQESQLPRALQIPTKEAVAMQRIKLRGVDLEKAGWRAVEAEIDSMTPEQYEKAVRGWYKRTIREIEKFNTTYEERPQLLSPLLLAVTHLELNSETRALGEELRRDLDSRRIGKSMVRVWDIATPEQIGGAASQMQLSTLKELFTSRSNMYFVKDENGRKVPVRDSNGNVIKDEETGEIKYVQRSRVADAFRHLEKTGNEINRLTNGYDLQLPDEGNNYDSLEKSTKRILESDYGIDESNFDERVSLILDAYNSINDQDIKVREHKRREFNRKLILEKGMEIRGSTIHFLGIKDFKIQERILTERREQKGKKRGEYLNLKPEELESVRKLRASRISLENRREEKVRTMNDYYTDGGSYGVTDIDKSGNSLTINQKLANLDEEKKELDGQLISLKNQLVENKTQTEILRITSELNQLEFLRSEQFDARQNGEELDRELKKQLTELEEKESFIELVKLLDKIEKNTEEHELYEDLQQAMILAGGIYRFSLRGARNDIKYKTGDFFAGRALNLTDRIVGRYKFAAGILNPVVGEYAGKEFSFGGQDFWENLCIDRAKMSEETLISEEINKLEADLEKLSPNDNKRSQIERKLIELRNALADLIEAEINSLRRKLTDPKLSEKERKEKQEQLEAIVSRRGDVINRVLNTRRNDSERLKKQYKIQVSGNRVNLEEAELENKELWNDFVNRYGIFENWYMADEIDMYLKIDGSTRSPLWKADSYFQNPNLQSFLELRGSLTHLNDESKKKMLSELLDRTLQWFEKNPADSHEAWEELDIFPESEKFGLIEEASTTEMISNSDRDKLFKKYLDFPLGGTPREKAQAKVMFDNLLAIWRWTPMRNQIALDSFWNLLKRSFSYVFAEDLGGR